MATVNSIVCLFSESDDAFDAARARSRAERRLVIVVNSPASAFAFSAGRGQARGYLSPIPDAARFEIHGGPS